VRARPVCRARRDEKRADLVAVQGDRTRLVIQPGTADMRSRGMLEQLFLDRELAESRDGAQPPGHGGPGPPAVFQIAGERFDIGAADVARHSG
jgi:hypothetical protein